MNKYIDREIERSYIKKLCTSDEAQVIFVSSKSGYGKSSLCSEVLKEILICPAIKIEMRNKEIIEQGFYLKQIALNVNNPINSIYFENSIKTYNKIEIAKQIPKITSKIVSSKYPVIKEIVEQMLIIKNDKQTFESSLCNYHNDDIIDTIKKSLIYLMSGEKFILNIENIQYIDETSLIYLKEILTVCKNFVLILEYTDNENSYISNIMDKFKINDIKPKLFEISRLDKSIILENLDEDKLKYKHELKKYIDNWDGNFWLINDFFVKKENKIEVLDTSLFESFKDEEMLYSLCLILTHIENLNIDLALQIGIKKEDIIKLEKKYKYIKIDDKTNFITIDHDTIYSFVIDNYSNVCIKAQKQWKDYYLNLLKNSNHLSAFYNSLYYSIIDNDIVSLKCLINRFKSLIINNISPEVHIKELEKVYYKININSNQNVDSFLYAIIELYQNISDHKSVYKLLNFINRKDEKYKMIYTLATYQNGYHQKAIDICSKELKIHHFDHQDIFYRLIRIDANYALNLCCKEVLEDYDYLSNHKKIFSSYFEYGYFLKFSRFINQPKEAIPDINKSINFFKKRSAVKQEVSSKITKSVLQAYSGDFKKSRNTIARIKMEDRKYLGLQEMIYNNLAILDIILEKNRSKINTDILDLLIYAKNHAFDSFSKLAINNNILAYKNYYCIDDELLIKEMEDQIEKRTFASTRIIRNCYINIYEYYNLRNNHLKNIYFDKIFQYGEIESHLYKWTEGRIIDKDDLNYPLSVPKYPLNYLMEWSIELDSSLMNF